MKLASIKVKDPESISDVRDGRLVVVRSDLSAGALVPKEQYANLRSAFDDWKAAEDNLRTIEQALERDNWPNSIDLSRAEFMAPLPRTFGWLDGSAFVEHIVRVRKARNAEPPADLYTVPLMYQGMSDTLLGPNDPIVLSDESFGLDFEGEVCVVLNETAPGTKAEAAEKHVALLMLMNDISLRNLIPRELATSFGFVHGKPASAFAPFAVTPDELGDAWKDGRVALDLVSILNQEVLGRPNGSEMHFSFYQLIEHAAKTRQLSAGTILGSGTFSNKDEGRGVSCLAEKRVLEQIHTGQAQTPFMKVGDVIELDMFKGAQSVFGKIRQTVVAPSELQY